MFHYCQNLKTVINQSKKCTYADIIYSTFHGSVHNGKPVFIVAFFSVGRMKLTIEQRIICLLKTNICSDFFSFQFCEIFNFHRCKFYIDTANVIASSMLLYIISCPDSLHHIVGIVSFAFTTDEQNPFMSFLQK